jgi:predicted lipid-binding transport protein (Tim44 family)
MRKEKNMSKLFTVMIAFLGLGMAAIDAEAARLGGGRSIGMQRAPISQPQAAPKTPAQQPAAPNSTTTPAQQPSGASKWLGPLAGLALGAGLAALFFNNGFAGALAGILMIVAIIAAAMFVIRMLRGRTATAPIQYAEAGAQSGSQPAAVPLFGGGAAAHSVAATTSRWPPGFDANEFVRHAKVNFIQMQAANDAKDLSTMRDFMAPGLFREIEADIRALGDAPQTTEVVTLDAEVLDVTTENELYVVSVRFSGLIRETAGAEPQQFSETWHLEKPLNGRSGWLVAGIQQN